MVSVLCNASLQRAIKVIRFSSMSKSQYFCGRVTRQSVKPRAQQQAVKATPTSSTSKTDNAPKSPAKKLASKLRDKIDNIEAEKLSTKTEPGDKRGLLGASAPSEKKGSRKRAHVKLAYENEVKLEPTEPKSEEVDFNQNCSEPDSKKILWVPGNWKEQYANILEMRKNRDAPVDTMGCERLAEEHEDPKVFRYQVLLALMLSSQTKDEITSAAMRRLQDHGCNIDNILKTSDAVLGRLLIPVGFWKKKVVYIKKTSTILKEKYNYDIPDNVKELCELPGVGPKMAYLVMTCAWDNCLGIGVDVHVHRISNRLGWVKKPTSQPEQTREELESWLPKEYWREVNYIFVGFGQQMCHGAHPKCASCLNKDICPYGMKELKKKK